MTRSGTDHELSGVSLNQLRQCNFIIAEDGDRGSLQYEILVNVPCEGVIVVYEDQI